MNIKQKNKFNSQDQKRVSDPNKKTKETTLIDSILNNLYQLHSSNNKKLKKEDFLKREKEKSRANNYTAKELAKNIFVTTDTTVKNKNNSNLASSYETNKLLQSSQKEKFNSHDNLKVKSEAKHSYTKSETNKRNLETTMKKEKNLEKASEKYENYSTSELNEKLVMLEAEKKQLEHEIFNFRKIIKNFKKEDLAKKLDKLEREKENNINTANYYLNLCSQLAEDVIVLRNQVDKLSHPTNQMNFNLNSSK